MAARELRSDANAATPQGALPLDDLRARVEAATGPDRETDVLVAVAMGWRTHPTGWVDPGGVIRAVSPFYTRSLDAVLALAGEKLPGWGWQVEGGEVVRKTGALATLMAPYDETASITDPRGWSQHTKALGATPALALLSALLAALASDGASSRPLADDQGQVPGDTPISTQSQEDKL